jgi:hypothetical protein
VCMYENWMRSAVGYHRLIMPKTNAPAAVSSPKVCPALARARHRSGASAARDGETRRFMWGMPAFWNKAKRASLSLSLLERRIESRRATRATRFVSRLPRV